MTARMDVRLLEATRDYETFRNSSFDTDPKTPASSLLADTGKDAYLVLLGCSLLQLPIWGFSVSYGVFQEYYSSRDLWGASSSTTGVIGTTLTVGERPHIGSALMTIRVSCTAQCLFSLQGSRIDMQSGARPALSSAPQYLLEV